LRKIFKNDSEGGNLKYREAYDKAMSYEAYVDILGDNLDLHQLHYKKFLIDQESEVLIKSFKPYKILVITEPWCGDSLALLPIIRKIAELNGKWEIKVLLRDENPDIMDQFLTQGVRGMPMFLFLDEDGNYLFKWGPRPEAAAQLFENYREEISKGKIGKIEVIKKIRTYYAKDRGVTTLAELISVFKENQVYETVHQ
jgi:hypothetical protein